MKATKVLEREHQIIEQVAQTCGLCADALREGFRIPSNVFTSIVGFLRIYDDQYHNEKEERLFAKLREKGVPAGCYPIVTLEHENEKLAVLINQLSAAVEMFVRSDGAVKSTLIDTLKALSEFYPDHIWKENYLLLPMADKLFSEGDQQALARALRAIDASKGEDAWRTVGEFNATLWKYSEGTPLGSHAAVA